jgi:hypothetical protein
MHQIQLKEEQTHVILFAAGHIPGGFEHNQEHFHSSSMA